ncbi:MAG TPA: protein kinase [Candidatus Eisenbacteria bacterium]|nr:protein kinase [Candidatus Eisenbacteria bacterium]
MTLAAGTRLGPYEIVAPLGSGGMGEVYRAHDTRLSRDVAIKALPAAFATDPDRLARFEREAKLLASLNHPNISGIFGLEQVEGARYLVLEFVAGETLAARLARGPLPVREALEIAVKIASGVEAAHESGVVHRDLKPGNVMITGRGGVKVLDFGLATGGAAGAAGSDASLSASPTMAYGGTSAGMILGTAAYMSPEQARGRVVDRRSDIWSFGCLLYECLAGRQAFQGGTVSDLIASILEREPDWSALPAATPARVRELLARCLRKDSHERLRDIGDARLELGEVLAAPAQEPGAPRAVPSRGTMIVAALVLAALLVVVWALGRRSVVPSAHRTAPLVATLVPSSSDVGRVAPAGVALSEDGTRLAFVGLDSLGRRVAMVRDLSSTTTVTIPASDGADRPFFSPDGRWLAFAAHGALWKARLPDGAAERIRGTDDGSMDPGGLISGGAWAGDGFIYYSVRFRPFRGILRVSADGGAPTRVAAPVENDGAYSLVSAEPLPGGRRLIAVAATSEMGSGPLVTIELATGATHPIGERATEVRFVGDQLLFRGQDGALYRLPFDPAGARRRGPAERLTTLGSSVGSGARDFAVSGNGLLAWLDSPPSAGTNPLWDVDRAGRAVSLPVEARAYDRPAISPSGTRLAVALPGDTGRDVWTLDLARNVLSRVTFGPDNIDPVWSPDGRRIAYAGFRRGTFEVLVRNADGSGVVDTLVAGPLFTFPLAWSPDGNWVVYRENNPTTNEDILMVSTDGRRTRRGLVQTPASELSPSLSPNGRWLAYSSDETGEQEIYLKPIEGGGRVQVSSGGGTEPRWSADGREVFFRSPTHFMAARVVPGDPIAVSRPVPLFEDRYLRNDRRSEYVVRPDGRGFIFIAPGGHALAVRLVVGWETMRDPIPTP